MKKLRLSIWAATALIGIASLNLVMQAAQDPRIILPSAQLETQIKSIDGPYGYDILFSDIRESLLADGTIGFYAPTAHDDMDTSARFSLSQYALCPALLDNSTNHQHVLVFLDHSRRETLPTQLTNSFTIINTTSYGAILLERR